MTDAQIVITAFGDRDTGGEAFVLEGERVRRLDWLASTGLAVDEAGGRVARLLRDRGEPDGCGELLVSDARGWTRGVALDREHVHVGLSVHRDEQAGGRAAVAILDRETLREPARVAVPAREVYALASVPAALVAGLEAGFRTNAPRVADGDQHALLRAAGVEPELLWAVADPLPEPACRTTLEASRGEHVLRIAPVQELVRWFDDVDPANGREARVVVTAAAVEPSAALEALAS